MVKILFIIGQLGIGGAERQLLYLCEQLEPKKYELLVCSLTDETPMRPLFEAAGINVVVLPKVMNPDLTRGFKIAQIIKSYQPDLIHAYMFVANTWVRVLSPWFNIPVILSERNSIPTRKFPMAILEWALSPLGSWMIANSRSGADQIRQNRTFNPHKISVIHNGIPLDQFDIQISGQEKRNFRHEYGLDINTKIIGMVANFRYQKNHELLFDAYQSVKDIHKDSCILCIGDGPREGAMRAYSKKIGIEHNVIFAGSRVDIPMCLSVMDVLVLPSRWEGLPNVILEGMAAGCPVVAADVGGIREIVHDRKTGFLVEPEDKIGLADAIIEVLQGGSAITNITQQAFKMVTEEFSIEKMVTKTEMVYQKLLGIN